MPDKVNPYLITIEGGGQLYSSILFETRNIIREHSFIEEDDATILASARVVIRMFDEFVEDTLQLHYAEGELYHVETSIHEFIANRNPIRYLMTDIGVLISKKYPNVASQFFTDRVTWFAGAIRSVELTGRIKDIYDLQADLHDFLRTIEGGILTNQLEQALRAFEGVTPDYKKLYMQGLSQLGSKGITGRQVFDAMCNVLHGIPATVTDIASATGKSPHTVRKGIDQILDNAGHLIRIDQRGKLEVYYIPEEFRRLHVL